MRRSLSLLLYMILTAVGLHVMGSTAPVAAAELTGEEQRAQVTVETMRPETVVLSEELSGRVAALQRVEIRPQVSGVILQRMVSEGARVAAGDPLFHIDPAPFQADLDMAEASLARAKAALDHAVRAAERSDGLLEKNAVSVERNDSAHNDLAVAKAGLAEAEALVARRRLDLQFATLRAPISGYVASGLADPGGLAAPGGERAMAIVQDLDRVYVDLKLRAGLLDDILHASRAGLGVVEVTTGQEGAAKIPGQLRFSDVIVDPGTGNISVRVQVENPGRALLPGMFVRASLPRGVKPDALLVPEEAILRKGGGEAQLVVVSDSGEAARRDVTLGERVANRIIITQGLAAGERVAVQGQDRVPDGMSIPVTAIPAGQSLADHS